MSHDRTLTDEQIEARRVETEKRIDEARARIVEVGVIRDASLDAEGRDLFPGDETQTRVATRGARALTASVLTYERRVVGTTSRFDSTGGLVTEPFEGIARAGGHAHLDLPQGLTLTHARQSDGGIDGKVAGYWNLLGYKVLGGVEDWPFGQEIVPEIEPDRVYPLLSLLADGRICIPTIPTFTEASDWIRNREIATPGSVCGCGQVHSGPGLAVGMKSSYVSENHNSVNLTILHADGTPGHEHPSHVLSLRDNLLLEAVEPPDAVAARAKEAEFKSAIQERRRRRGPQGPQGEPT